MPMNNTCNLNKLINKTTHKRQIAISQYQRQSSFSSLLAETKFFKCFLLAARRDGKTIAVFRKSRIQVLNRSFSISKSVF